MELWNQSGHISIENVFTFGKYMEKTLKKYVANFFLFICVFYRPDKMMFTLVEFKCGDLRNASVI